MAKNLVESFSGVRFEAGVDKRLKDDAVGMLAAYAASFRSIVGYDSLVVLGMDPRPSSAPIKEVLLEHLGGEALDLGIATTPETQEAIRYLGRKEQRKVAGIMITGSHSKLPSNGFKPMGPTGMLFDPDEFTQLKNEKEAVMGKCERQPALVMRDYEEAKEHYVDFLFDLIGGNEVIAAICDYVKEAGHIYYLDPNGGSATRVLEIIADRTQIPFRKKHFEIGHPGREIEPCSANLRSITEELEDNAVAWCFDYDADRVEKVLPTTSRFAKRNLENVVSGQYVLALLVDSVLRDFASEAKNQVVVTNDATSGVVREVVQGYDAHLEETEVGEVNVVKRMQAYGERCKCGGEGSSSGVIVKPSTCRDGILAMLLTLKLMAQRKENLDSLLMELPEYHTLRQDFIIDPKMSPQVNPALQSHFRGHGYPATEIRSTGDATGGLKFCFGENSWLWYRGSKTNSDEFRMIVDSKSRPFAEQLFNLGKRLFEETYAGLT